jgi:hypothetical protein
MLMQDDLAAGLAGGALLAQRAGAAQRTEGGNPGSTDRPGDGVGAGHRASLVVNGEVIHGEPARNRRLQRLGLEHRDVPAPAMASRRSPVP